MHKYYVIMTTTKGGNPGRVIVQLRNSFLEVALPSFWPSL